MDDKDDLRDAKKRLGLTATILRRSADDSQDELAKRLRSSGKRVSEIETGKKASPDRVQEVAECLGLSRVHVLKVLNLIESIQDDLGGSCDPLGPTPDQEIVLYEAGRELAAGFEAIFLDRIRTLKLESAREAAGEQWKRLEPLTPAQRVAEVRADAAFHTWAFCLYLCDKSVRLAAHDPKEAIHAGRLAVVAAQGCTSLLWSGRLLAYALAHLANAYRVVGDHHEADKLFARANRLWSAGPADPNVLDPGRIFDLEASLRKDQRRLPEALALLKKAESISRIPGRILVSKSIVLSLMGRYEEAIATLRRAEAVFEELEPRDEALLKYNEGVNLCHLGRFDEAAAFADAAFEILEASGNRIDILRSRWLRARVLGGQGDLIVSLGTYEELVDEFMKLEMFYDLALVTLEIAALLLSLGRTQECRGLVAGLPEYFEAKKIYPEALAALKLFADSVRQETATEALARQVVSFLYLARGNQGLHFQPATS